MKRLWRNAPREGERMPLEIGNLGAGDKDVLSSASRCFLLLDLNLHYVGRVLDHLGDVGPVAGANFTENAFADPDETTNKPVALRRQKENARIQNRIETSEDDAPRRHRYCSKNSTGDDQA
jgi:hypothetical protein